MPDHFALFNNESLTRSQLDQWHSLLDFEGVHHLTLRITDERVRQLLRFFKGFLFRLTIRGNAQNLDAQFAEIAM